MNDIKHAGRNPGVDGGPDRSSEIVVYNGVGHFVATPERPYDPTLSAAEAMKEALVKCDRRLGRIGSDRADLLTVQIWLRDMRFFAEINKVWDAWIDQDAMPLRCCCACEMGHPDLKLELIISARAHKDPE